MRSDSGHTQSLWMETADVPRYRALMEDVTVDVCVVGAGIAGLMTAYFLTREGRKVIVIDDGLIAGGETGRTTAHLSNAFDDRYVEVAKMHGEMAARLTADSHTAAIDALEQVVTAEKIDCDFRRLDGWLFLGEGDREKQSDLLDREYAAATRAGVRVEREASAPVPGMDVGPALRFPNQAQFHPVKFLAGLARAIVARGGRICTETHADAVEGGDRPSVKTSDGRTIRAGAICVCTNSPISDYVVMHLKQAPYRSFVIGAAIAGGSVEPALFWDTESPYHYVRLMKGTASGEDVLIVGGEDHKTGQADDAGARFLDLEEWTRQRFPAAGPVTFRWSGQVLEPADYLAFIGPNPDGAPNVYIATGDSGNGMTHGAIAGMLLTDLVLGRPNKWAELYDPKRITVRSAGELLKENLNVAVQYADWVKPGETDDVANIPPGEGAVVRRGAHRVAAYRDEEGNLHERSATCTHLACVVRWNGTEKSWDCPCHGSRFDALGNVVNGPAINSLGTAEPDASGPRAARGPEASA